MKTKYDWSNVDKNVKFISVDADGITGFVISDDGSDKFPVEVQFVGFSELFNYDELEFLGESIEND